MGALANRFDYWFKRRLRWSPTVRKRVAGSFSSLIVEWTSEQRERWNDLQDRYDLSFWPSVCTDAELCRNLWILDALDVMTDPEPCAPGGLDVGSLNWWYLPALQSFNKGPWRGVEIDAFQRYLPRMTTRKAHAEFLCEAIPDSEYRAQSVLEQEGSFGLITWFLPYLTKGSLRSGGLPDRFFDPDQLWSHVWSLLQPGGTLVVANQGAQEVALQKEIFSTASVDVRYTGPMTSVFYECPRPRFGWVARKP